MDNIGILILTLSVLGAISSIIAIYKTFKINVDNSNKEELKNITEDLKKNIDTSISHIFDIMLSNVAELKEYYTISKRQANQSFKIASLMSLFGFLIYISGLVAVLYWDKDVKAITLISGTIIEVVSALSYWLYTQSIKQLNIYYNNLASTEKYLTVMQLIEMVPEERKYEEYRNLINYILNNNQDSLRHMREKQVE
ncbi:MAG: hypothetical protein JJE17_03410 [Peptostreptococcaceae bacterium]|nr:hypothetical protein [Peptostreptococcaceae bacterium]